MDVAAAVAPLERIAKAPPGQHIEKRLAHAICRGPQMRRGIALAHRGQRTAAKFTGHDAHQPRISAFSEASGPVTWSGVGDRPISMRRLPIM